MKLNKIHSLIILVMIYIGSIGFLYSQSLPPVNLSAKPIEENRIQLEWSKPTSYTPTYYKIYRSVNDTISFSYIAIVPGDRNIYIDNNLLAGIKYSYFVTAIKQSSDSEPILLAPSSNIATVQAISGLSKIQISNKSTGAAELNKTYSLKISAQASDFRAVLRYSLLSAPSGMSIDSVNGIIYWKPTSPGRYEVKVNVKNINDPAFLELGVNAPQTTHKYVLQVATRVSSIKGRVVNEVGVGVGNAIIKLYQVNNDQFSYEIVSDYNGEFSLSSISAGDYYIFVKGPDGYNSYWYPSSTNFEGAQLFRIVEGVEVTETFILKQNNPSLAFASGVVKDTLGNAINNAAIYFYEAGKFLNSGLENASIEDLINPENVYFTNSTLTNSNGEYSVQLPKGKYYFALCKADGYYYMFYNNQTSLLYGNKIYLNSNRDKIDFNLIPVTNSVNKIKGKVVSDDLNEGLESRIILVKKAPERGGGGGRVPYRGTPSILYKTYKTDINGNFEIENIDTTQYLIQAVPYGNYLPSYYNPSGVTLKWFEADSINVFGTISGIKVKTPPAMIDGLGIITGRVLTSIGESIPGIIVYAVIDNTVVAYGVTDSLGYYLIKGLRPGLYHLFADCFGYETVNEKFVHINYSQGYTVNNINIVLDPYNFSLQTPVINEPFIPESYKLKQNYPNPFNPTTTIEFSIEKEGFVDLKVYDILGREVARLINTKLAAGSYKTVFNASNLPSGVYFVSMKAENQGKVVYTKQIKMLLTK